MNIIKHVREVFILEKIISDDEKIKRAEEIYLRRNNQNINLGSSIQKKKSIKDKFFLHLLIMLDIAILIFCIQNKDFIFTERFLSKLNEINEAISTNITTYLKGTINKQETINDSTEKNIIKENKTEEQIVNNIRK